MPLEEGCAGSPGIVRSICDRPAHPSSAPGEPLRRRRLGPRAGHARGDPGRLHRRGQCARERVGYDGDLRRPSGGSQRELGGIHPRCPRRRQPCLAATVSARRPGRSTQRSRRVFVDRLRQRHRTHRRDDRALYRRDHRVGPSGADCWTGDIDLPSRVHGGPQSIWNARRRA